MTHRDGTSPSRPAPTQGAELGLLEWFVVNEHERVERVLADMNRLGVAHLRTGVSWADWHTDEGQAWYRWLLPRLARDVQVLPCVLYTPPSMGLIAATSSPPRETKPYADFLDLLISDFGEHFEWVELWNEPNNLSEWNWTLDPGWRIFSKMIIGAGYWARHRGKKVILGGASPIDPAWFDVMCRRGVIEHVDAVGIHGFPGTWEATWQGWPFHVQRVRDTLEARGHQRPIWITETGFSTWRHDELRQIEHYLNTINAPVQRVYWYAMDDLDPDRATVDGFHSDEREYHFGMKRHDGSEKLLFRLRAESGDDERIRHVGSLNSSVSKEALADADALIIGGAGFIGSQLAKRLLLDGQRVRILDNLSSPGVEHSIIQFTAEFGSKVQVDFADVRNRAAIKRTVRGAKCVYHLAGCACDGPSPTAAFEVRARGTLNLLEALREMPDPPPLIYAAREAHSESTNPPHDCAMRYAEQLVRAYAHSYGLKAVALRMGCIYGPRPRELQDRCPVTGLMIAALQGKQLPLDDDEAHVLNLLYIDDLVAALLAARKRIELLSGGAFDIHGARAGSLCREDLSQHIETVLGQRAEVRHRTSVSAAKVHRAAHADSFEATTGWSPAIELSEGLQRLYDSITQERSTGQRRWSPLSRQPNTAGQLT